MIHKRELNYTSSQDPLKFIERLEDLSEAYGIGRNILPGTMVIMLQDKALMWLMNNNRRWTEWEAFKKDFLRFLLPTRYFQTLEDEIQKRTQNSREAFKGFVLALQALMKYIG